MNTTELGSLPNEVLTNIAMQLLAPAPVTRFNPREQETKAIGAIRSAENQSREDLRNLCLVSKRYAQIAQPCLLENIVVSDYETLTRLLRTLSESAGLGKFVKILVLEVTFHRGDPRHVQIDFSPLSLQQADELRGSSEGIFNVSQEFAEHRMICHIYFKILQKTWRLECLSIQLEPVPARRHAPPHIMHSFSELAKRVSAEIVRSADTFLIKLQSLLLCGNPSEPYVEFDARIVNPFLGLKGLTSILCARDQGNWPHVGLPPAIGSAIGKLEPSPSVRTEDIARQDGTRATIS